MRFSGACALLGASVTLVSGLGINCEGSSSCILCAGGVMASLRDQIQASLGTVGNNFYPEGAHAACQGNCCVFYQNGASGTLNDIAPKMDDLVNHGCKQCGSTPTQPGNDVSTGELTVNYVSEVNHCVGICPPPV